MLKKKKTIQGDTEFQRELNAEYKDATTSPLKDKDRKHFEGLEFFKFDSTYVVTATLERTPNTAYFNMKTTTDRIAKERVYGFLTFELKGKSYQLNIYQGKDLMTREGYDHAHLISIIKRLKSTYNIEIILEPGSAIAWQTGYLRSKVLDIVDAQGVDVAILDISFAAHMPDTLEMPYKPKVWGATDAIPGKPTYRLGGMTCLAGDYMADYSFEKPLNIGDTLIFDDMIHYTMVKTTTFNGVGLPSMGIWHEDNTFELVKSFGYEVFKEKI